jgi:glutamine amidotransferase-like uncharacterized protein
VRISGWHAIFTVIFSLLLGSVLTGCGSPSSAQQAASTPPVPILPAIAAAEPVLLFNGTGTTNSDVAAVEAILGNLNLGYITANSAQLDSLSEQQLAGYKLIIIPGGNSITIGENLSAAASSNIRGAVQAYGTHYLGICAGAFFGGYSIYNGVDLTGGVSFSFYAAENQGIHTEPVLISFPSGTRLDVYWQDGPQLSGWGSVVAKFPDGTPAVVEGTSGKGFVIFTGVHPEAPESWRGSMAFSTSVSADLSYAATIISAALSGKPLAHF